MENFDTKIGSSTEFETIMDPGTLIRVVNYCYTKDVSVDEYDQVFQLLRATTEYGISMLHDQCQQFLSASMDAKTALRFLHLSNANGFDPLAIESMKIIGDNFENIVNELFFNELSAQDLTKILQSDGLCVRHETIVFTAVLKWLCKADHMDLDSMMGESIPVNADTSELMSHIKFPLLDNAVSIRCNTAAV